MRSAEGFGRRAIGVGDVLNEKTTVDAVVHWLRTIWRWALPREGKVYAHVERTGVFFTDDLSSF